jgi:hypothetical protein
VHLASGVDNIVLASPLLLAVAEPGVTTDVYGGEALAILASLAIASRWTGDDPTDHDGRPFRFQPHARFVDPPRYAPLP